MVKKNFLYGIGLVCFLAQGILANIPTEIPPTIVSKTSQNVIVGQSAVDRKIIRQFFRSVKYRYLHRYSTVELFKIERPK